MMNILSIGGGFALLGAVLTGGVVSASAEPAQSDGATAILAQAPGSAEATSSYRERLDAYLQKVADNLGITLDALKAARTDASLATLDEKVADGTIDPERAEAIRERIEEGDFFGFGLAVHHHMRIHHLGIAGTTVEELTSFLGIDAATLREAHAEGKSLATIAEEAGTTRDELKAFLTAQATVALDEAVANGRLTQEEADAKMARFLEHLDAAIDGELGGRPGMHRGARGEGGQDDGASFRPGRGVTTSIF